jgi:hypothetical protein
MVASLRLLQMIFTTPVVRERQSRAHEEQGFAKKRRAPSRCEEFETCIFGQLIAASVCTSPVSDCARWLCAKHVPRRMARPFGALQGYRQLTEVLRTCAPAYLGRVTRSRPYPTNRPSPLSEL